MYRASVIALPKDLVKEGNSILYFIWNGKDKVKHQALISDLKKGRGLKMIDIESMIKTQRVATLKKFLEEYPSPWKTILNKLLSLIGDRCFVLYCNFDTSKLKIQLPVYYKECLNA